MTTTYYQKGEETFELLNEVKTEKKEEKAEMPVSDRLIFLPNRNFRSKRIPPSHLPIVYEE